LAVSPLLVGIVACNSGDDTATTEPAATTTGATESAPNPTESDRATTGSREFEVVAAPTGWNPVLDGVIASPAASAGTCDTQNPNFDGARELPLFMQTGYDSTTFGGPWTSWFAAFDPTTHGVTVLGQGYDGSGNGARLVAGSLDVCTDTWTPISATLTHPDTGRPAHPTALVYDVDSDAMVAYTSEGVFVLDTGLDEWQHRPVPRDDSGSVERLVVGAAYHPASGMIVVADGVQLFAHDVDIDEWMPITTLPFDPGGGDFLGVNVAMDRFVIGVAGTGRDDETTWLADPVSGESMVVQTPEHSHVNIVWPNEAFGPADGTVFVTHRVTGEICGFDADTLAWNRCVTSSTEEPGPGWAIVGDPVNDRLIGISTTTIETWPLPQP
jgi:hypothetical protein